MIKEDRFCALLLLGIAIATCLGASQLTVGTFAEPGPGLFPMCLGAILGLLSLIIIAGGILVNRAARDNADRPEEKKVSFSKEALRVGAALLIYGLLLEPLGFIVTTFLVFTLMLRLVAQQKWHLAAVVSAVLTLASYFLFATLLGVSLPHGVFAF